MFVRQNCPLSPMLLNASRITRPELPLAITASGASDHFAVVHICMGCA